jgi:Translation initiation factor eIF3 subunit 135
MWCVCVFIYFDVLCLFTELKFAMLEAQSNNLLHSFHLAEELHRSGINMRYIGLVYSIFRKRFEEQTQLAGLLLVEACSRVVKKLLNDQLREKMKELKLPSEVPYRRLTVEFLNLVFRNTEESTQYWETVIAPELNRSYNFSFDLEHDVVHHMACFDLGAVDEATGFKFSGGYLAVCGALVLIFF